MIADEVKAASAKRVVMQRACHVKQKSPQNAMAIVAGARRFITHQVRDETREEPADPPDPLDPADP